MTAQLKAKRPSATDPIDVPFVILCDTREQTPFTFEGINGDSKQGRRPLKIQVERSTLPTGDYSIRGFENLVSIERKSLPDLFACMGRERERFEREIERLNRFQWAHVVIESDWRDITLHPPTHSKLNPKTVSRTIAAWAIRYPRVHWWPMPYRWVAERKAFRLLERVWKETQGTQDDREIF